LEKLDIRKNSIIMAHCPPYLAQDKIHSGEHVGSKAISKCIEVMRPKIWLCGHIHEDYGVSKIGETLVINCACDNLKGKLRGVIFDTERLQYECIGDDL